MKRRRRRNAGRKWIRKAIKRPGALRRKFARWYNLKPNQKIPASMYAKGYKRAKRRGDTRTMRQINLARTLSRMPKRGRKRRRKSRVIRGVRFGAPRRRRIAANRSMKNRKRSRKNHRSAKSLRKRRKLKRNRRRRA